MERSEFRKGSTRLYDDTAYKALTNIEREESEMDRTGEIWEIEYASGRLKEAVILSDYDGLCQCIILTDEWNDKCDIELNCRGRRYGCSRMIQYSFDNRVTGYIRTLTDDELDDIQMKVAEGLGIEVQEEHDNSTEVERVANDPHTELELAKANAQLEVYKNMYNDLLQMTLKGAV